MVDEAGDAPKIAPCQRNVPGVMLSLRSEEKSLNVGNRLSGMTPIVQCPRPDRRDRGCPAAIKEPMTGGSMARSSASQPLGGKACVSKLSAKIAPAKGLLCSV